MAASAVLSRLFFAIVFARIAQRPISAASDKISGWPGQPAGFKFNQYAGYVTIDKTTGKSFYYTFIEAETSPATKPVVLWLNGGPGCSSLWGGFMTEHGPWRLTGAYTNKLKHNPFSWNKVANMIYLESPAGVGFSYSNSFDDYYTNDLKTGVDNYRFLIGFFKKYPQFQKNRFFITGESYAGRYIPQLASEILKREKNPKGFKYYVKLNFKGFLIGAPYFGDFDYMYYANYYYSRFIISSEQYRFFKASCSGGNPFACNFALNMVYDILANADPYDIYSPVCTSPLYLNLPNLQKSDSDRFTKISKFWEGFSQFKEAKKKNSRAQEMGTTSSTGIPAPSTVPKPFSIENPYCNTYWTYRYLNNATIRRKINARLTGFYKDEAFQCSRTLGYSQNMVTEPLYKTFFASKLRIWLFGGDADSVVPFSVIRDVVARLNVTPSESYRTWFYYDQPGGWAQTFNKLTMFTIRDAGHLFPIRQPERSLYVFKQFLAGKPLASSPFGSDTT